MDKVCSRLTAAEGQIGQVEDTVEEHDGIIHTLQFKLKTQEYRAKDAENRFRRNNIHIIGLAERAGGKTPTVFVEELMCSLLSVAQLSPYFMVERAHRMLPQPGPQGKPLHTPLYFGSSFSETVMRSAGELHYKNNLLMLLPDYSVETQKLRRSLNSVKAAICTRGLKSVAELSGLQQ